jgi:hypothetical protein
VSAMLARRAKALGVEGAVSLMRFQESPWLGGVVAKADALWPSAGTEQWFLAGGQWQYGRDDGMAFLQVVGGAKKGASTRIDGTEPGGELRPAFGVEAGV